MNQLPYIPSELRNQRRLLACLSLFSLALIGAALYLQFYQRADPCPLCILQRYAYWLIAFFTLFGATARSASILRLAQILTLIAAASGMIAVGRQLWLLAHPFLSCGFDALEPILDKLPLAKSLPFMFKVAGLCESTNIPVLGLPLPAWSLIGYLVIFGLVSYSFSKKITT